MRRVALIALALAAVMTLPGCALVSKYVPFYEPGPDKIGKATHLYCGVFSPDRREGFRKTANAHAHPHEIKIICDGDNSTNEDN